MRQLAAGTAQAREAASALSSATFRVGAGFLRNGLGRLLRPLGEESGGLSGWLNGRRLEDVVEPELVGVLGSG
jgi:hypothetical protein